MHRINTCSNHKCQLAEAQLLCKQRVLCAARKWAAPAHCLCKELFGWAGRQAHTLCNMVKQ